MIDVTNLCLKQGAFQLADISFHVPRGSYAMLMGKTEAAGRRAWMEEKGHLIEADI